MGLQTENLSGPGFHRWTFSPGLLPRPCPQQQLRLTAGTGAGAPPSSPPRPAPGACRGVAATGARSQGHNGGSAPAGRGRGREPGRSQASQAPPTLGTERPGSTPPSPHICLGGDHSQANICGAVASVRKKPALRLPPHAGGAAACPLPSPPGSSAGPPADPRPPGLSPDQAGKRRAGQYGSGVGTGTERKRRGVRRKRTQ